MIVVTIENTILVDVTTHHSSSPIESHENTFENNMNELSSQAPASPAGCPASLLK